MQSMRPIDADQLLDFIKFYGRVVVPESHIVRDIVLLIQTAPTIAPPPNDPLTPEQLREMDGESVWVEMFVKGLKSHWAIVYGKYLSDGRFWSDKERFLLSIDKTGGYGLVYLAYRRKPEAAND